MATTTLEKPMLAFVNAKATKPQLVANLEAHAAADRIAGGWGYWDTKRGVTRGCAVGCSIHDFSPGSESRHAEYEPLFGVPQVLARLEDSIFERLPEAEQKAWPLRFARAIPVGADLSGVWDRFALWLLVDPDDGVVKYARQEQTRAAIAAVGDLYRRQVDGDRPTREQWREARAAAAAAYADAAADAAAYAARQLAAVRQAGKLIELIETAPVPEAG